MMDAKGFHFDISQKPDLLQKLLTTTFDWSPTVGKKILFLGMGSSHFANVAITDLLNQFEMSTHALLASASELPHLDSNSVVIAVSASGNSIETLAALDLVPVGVTKIALTNNPNSKIAEKVDHVIELHAGVENGGVAVLTYLATLVALLRLVQKRSTFDFPSESLLKAVDSLRNIISTQDQWLPELRAKAVSPDGTFVAAPLSRLCSASQSALMLREGPRVLAVASEVGDWSHIDVYLTKTKDYRLIVFPGSVWTEQMLDWTTQRNSTVIAIGHELVSAALNLRYINDDDTYVRLMCEVTYCEILSAHLWMEQLA
jgi:glucosamine 6-phosphate synthetase-like amidotransferase/phosphosugar isomerase protein